MLLNSKDIATEFNAEFLSQEFGLQNSTLGDFSGGRYVSFSRQFAGAPVVYNFLVRGESESEFYLNCFALYEELKVATIKLDDSEITYTGQAINSGMVYHGEDDFSTTKVGHSEFGVLTVQMLVYQGIGPLITVTNLAAFKPEGIKEPFIVLEVKNNTAAELPEIALNGFGNAMVIKKLGAGKTMIIDGLNTTVKVGNANAINQYEATAWPVAKAGVKHTITTGPGSGVSLVLKYYPRWV